MNASVGIFQKTAPKVDISTQPAVPDELFKAVQRVIESQSTELVKSRDCMYIVQYSLSGPFSSKIGDEWLPVYIARVLQWTSGGIKQEEMDAYNEQIDQ